MQKLTAATFSPFIAGGTRIVFIGAKWAAPACVMGDIVAQTGGGSQWSDGTGMSFQFAGGGSVGVTASGKIVGGP